MLKFIKSAGQFSTIIAALTLGGSAHAICGFADLLLDEVALENPQFRKFVEDFHRAAATYLEGEKVRFLDDFGEYDDLLRDAHQVAIRTVPRGHRSFKRFLRNNELKYGETISNYALRMMRAFEAAGEGIVNSSEFVEDWTKRMIRNKTARALLVAEALSLLPKMAEQNPDLDIVPPEVVARLAEGQAVPSENRTLIMQIKMLEMQTELLKRGGGNQDWWSSRSQEEKGMYIAAVVAALTILMSQMMF